MLQRDRLERRLLGFQQMAATFRAAGADVPMLDVTVELEKFDEWLDSAPVPLSPTEALLRELEVV